MSSIELSRRAAVAGGGSMVVPAVPIANPDSLAGRDAPILSVVLPNYNHARLIARALEALLAQDPAPDEVILVDDASTDDSLDVVAPFAARHPALRIIVNPSNTGAIATLARGLAAARGRYVYFAAADDWVFPGFFRLAVRMLERYRHTG